MMVSIGVLIAMLLIARLLDPPTMFPRFSMWWDEKTERLRW